MKKLSVALTVAALAIPAAPAVAQSQYINILTGGTSGVYYPLGVALGEIYDTSMEDVRVQVQSTKASVENLNLLQAGRGEIAFTLGDSLVLGWEGDEEAGFREPLQKLRGIAAIYPNYVQIVASAESGIATLADLAGATMSVGAPRSGTELNARAILEAAGMSYDDLGRVEYLPFAESVELMKNRQLDATLQSAGLGVASIRDLSTSVDVAMVEVPSDVIETLGPPYISATIPAGTYEGQDQDVQTAAIVNFLVTHEDVPEETVYQMTKLLFENLPQLVAAHNAASDISLETATEGMPVPLHPGAERYYREAGIIQ